MELSYEFFSADWMRQFSNTADSTDWDLFHKIGLVLSLEGYGYIEVENAEVFYANPDVATLYQIPRIALARQQIENVRRLLGSMIYLSPTFNAQSATLYHYQRHGAIPTLNSHQFSVGKDPLDSMLFFGNTRDITKLATNRSIVFEKSPSKIQAFRINADETRLDVKFDSPITTFEELAYFLHIAFENLLICTQRQRAGFECGENLVITEKRRYPSGKPYGLRIEKKKDDAYGPFRDLRTKN